jgi:hypothetical protein
MNAPKSKAQPGSFGSTLCAYMPGPAGECINVGCRGRGGQCAYIGGKRGRERCRCRVGSPSENVAESELEVAVETAMSIYRQRIRELPACSADWFTEALARARAGDEMARRTIQGGCGSRVLSVVEARYANATDEELLGLVQDANVALERVVETFSGESVEEFLPHLDAAIERQLQQMALEVS